jgi:exo-beta-1,3-glucanase (GH17 family)
MNPIPYNTAICYSGYRDGQSPRDKTYPSKDEILEDLRLLEGEFYHLRLYDCSPHAYRTLEVIEEHQLNFKVMLGLSLAAEENHIDHPYHYVYPTKLLNKFKQMNKDLAQEIIDLANRYESIVSAVSIGNEIRSIWSNRRIPISRMIEVANQIKHATNVPVTYCEEYHLWIEELQPLAEVLDIISLHTYPAWQGVPIEDALEAAVRNYHEVQSVYPDKPCIITETGWPTSSHGAKIKVEDAIVVNQHTFNSQILKWSEDNHVLVYLFEAFDEPWKGGNHPAEPEKHWGIYYENRTRK